MFRGNDLVSIDIIAEDIGPAFYCFFHKYFCKPISVVKKFSRIGDPPGQSRGRRRVGRREIYLGLFGPHPAGIIPVRGRDNHFGGIGPPEGVFWAAQTRRAGGFAHQSAGIFKNVRERLPIHFSLVEVFFHFPCGGYDEGVDHDFLALEQFCRRDKVGQFAAGTGADIGSVQFYIGAFSLTGVWDDRFRIFSLK